MSVCVLELNDFAVTVTLPERGAVVTSPGYAIVDGERIVVGEEAYRRARLTPRGSHCRFWDQLGLDPLPRSGGSVKTQADLAYAHLDHVWRRVGAAADSVVLAVPGTFEREQLGLLLGIAQECAMPVIGMVDAAVAAAAPVPAGRDVAVLDLQLHRCIITRLDGGNEAVRRSVEDIGQSGLIALYDVWANAVSDAFVHATRFDPLHLAATEQALYDRLPVWLARLQQESRTVIELESQHKSHTATLERRQLETAADRIYRQIAQALNAGRRPGQPLVVQLTTRGQALPGLIEHLTALPDTQVVRLRGDAAARGVLARLELIRTAEGESVGFVTSLPWPRGEQTSQGEAAQRPERREQPTHVLHSGRAYPLGAGEFLIGTRLPAGGHGLGVEAAGLADAHCRLRSTDGQLLIEDLSGGSTFVNETRVDRQAIGRVGDSLRLGDDVTLQLIRVIDGHGA